MKEPDEDFPPVALVPLPRPRPLTPKERALLDFVLAGPLGRDELRRQAETARVNAVCSCGCPSVGLEVDPAAPAAEFTPDELQLPMLTAYQYKRRGWTEVTVHLAYGRLHELEIWAGKYGVRPRVDLAKLEYAS